MKNVKNRILSLLLAVFITAGIAVSASVTVFAAGAVIEVNTEAQLVEALDMDTPVSAINIVSGFTLTQECIVKFDPEHFDNYKDVVVTISEDVTLKIAGKGCIGTAWYTFEGDWGTPPVPNGKIINNGTIIVENGGYLETIEENNGSIMVLDGAVAICCAVNNGLVDVEGGMYLTPQGPGCKNNGAIRVGENGAVISRFGCPIINEEGGTIQLDGEFLCGVTEVDGGVMLFENHGEVTGSGSVTLDFMGPEDAEMPDMDAMIERMMEQLGQEKRFDNWNDIEIYKQYEVTKYEDIVSHIDDERTVAGEKVRGNMDTKFFVIGDIVMPEGDSIRTMALIVVAEDSSLTVSSGAELEAGIINRSTVEVQSGGKLSTTQGGDIINEGELIVREGATIASQMGRSVINTEGAQMILDGTFSCGCLNIEGNDICWFENNGKLIGDGEIALYEVDHTRMPVNDIEALADGIIAGMGESNSIDIIQGGSVIEVENEDELYAALNADIPVAAVIITKDFTVTKDCTVKFDPEHFDNYKDVVVMIDEGVTLTVMNGGSMGTAWYTFEGDWDTPPVPNGRVINNGTIIVDDNGWLESIEENNGTIIVKDGAIAMCAIENNGTVTVEGGMYLTPQGSKCINKGTVKVGENGIMISRFGTPIINEEDGTIQLDGEFMCGILGFEDGVMLFENHGEVTGSGSVTLDFMGPEDTEIPDMDAMIERMMEQLGQKTRFEDWDDISIYVQYEATSYEDIKSRINEERTVAGEKVNGNMDTKFFVMGDIVIPEGDSILTMALIVVAEDSSLTVSDGAELQCGIINRSKIEVKSGGKLSTTQGGNIVNEGELIIQEGAELTSCMGGVVINEEGAKLTLDGKFNCGCIGGASGDGCWFENFGEAKGKGSIILYEATPDIMPVNDMDQLSVYVAEKFKGTEEIPDIIIGERAEWTPGDINGDGEVDNKDIVTLFRYVSGGNAEVNEIALDTNGDGEVDNKDIVTLFRYVSGGTVELSDKPYTPAK